MRCQITNDEWRLLGQMVQEIINGQYPAGLRLECAVLFEWYSAEMSKFHFVKTRTHKFKISQLLALHGALIWLPDNPADTYYQIIKQQLIDKIDNLVKSPLLRVTGKNV